MYNTLIHKNNQERIAVESNALMISKCIMFSGTLGILLLFSNISVWAMKSKLYAKRPLEAEAYIHKNGPGHMTKMVTIPI